MGLCTLGATVYAFLALSARALGPARYGALSALWALVFLMGPGVFFPVEQEVSRAVAARQVAGVGSAPLVRRAAVVAVGLATGCALVAVSFASLLLRDVFDGQALMLVGLIVSSFAYATMHLLRGLLSGGGRFRAYGVVLGAEGVLRLAAAIVLVAAGVRTAGPFGLVVGLAPFLAVGVVMVRQTGLLHPGPPAPWPELSRSLGLLLVGSLLGQVLIHSGPVAVRLLAEQQSSGVTGRFSAGLLLTRVPLFLFLAVQAALLPKLSARAAAGDREGFRAELQKILAITVVTGVVSVAGALVAGRLALQVLFGASFLVGRRDLALLASSTGCVMISLAISQALVALQRQGWVAWSWLAGVVSYAMFLLLPGDPVLRVELGLVLGSAVAAVAMAVGLRAAVSDLSAPFPYRAGAHRSAAIRSGSETAPPALG